MNLNKKMLASVLSVLLCTGLVSCAHTQTSMNGAANEPQTEESAAELPATDETPSGQEEVPPVTADDMRDLFDQCTGYAGTAGSSLHAARAASFCIAFANEHALAAGNPEVLRAAILDAYQSLEEEQRMEFDVNFASEIAPLAEAAFAGPDAEPDSYSLFSDAGETEQIAVQIAAPDALRNWDTLRSYIFIMGNEMS